MMRLLIGAALIGGAAYFGRRTSSGLSAPARGYLERALDDVGQFALVQFPRGELEPGSDPRVDDPDFQMQCATAAPYLEAGFRHLAEAIDIEERGAEAGRALFGQAWSAAAQPGRCPKMRAPAWLLEG